MPEGWLVGIVDRRGDFIARTLAHQRTVGKPASTGWQEIMRRSGVFEFPTLEGDTVVEANVVSPLSGWAVGVATNKAVLDAAPRHSLWEMGLAGGAIILLGLLLAAIFARNITRSIGTLEKNATVSAE